MNQAAMNIVQQKRRNGCFEPLTLGAESRAQSITLRTGRNASILKVERGMAWVTLPGTASQAPQDLWLQAGQSLPLAARQTLWVDGWPHAELSVHAAESPLLQRLTGRLFRWVSRLKRRAAASQMPCSAA
ncbi:MAG: DUF2917 domain-containing protein [Burkholderiales bacterium]